MSEFFYIKLKIVRQMNSRFRYADGRISPIEACAQFLADE